MIRLGVVGLRNIGLNHVRKAAELDDVQVVAGADTDLERAEAAKQEYGFEYVTDNATKLFNDDSLDGVVLALPNHLHSPLSIEALNAGRNVLVEKPITGFSSEVEPMIEARDRSGKTLMVGLNQRFSPKQYALRQALRDGVIGNAYLAKTFWNRRFPFEGLFQRGAWGFKKDTSGGGPLLDLGIHKLDLLMFLLDFPEVESVSGFCSYGIGKEACAARGIDYEVEDFGMGMIRFKSGLCIHLESSYFHNQSEMDVQDFFISGTEGVLRADGIAKVVKGEESELDIADDVTAPTSCVDHFCRVLRGEEALSSTAEQALIGLKIIEAIYESSDSGQPVSLENCYAATV